MMDHLPSVHEDARVTVDAVELQRDPPALVRSRDLEFPAVPSRVVLRKTRAHRLESVILVGFLVEGKLHRPVMRKVHRAPKHIVEPFTCGTGIDASFVEV
jgi:hypothetical protein